jgi:hypothetical protein
MSCTRQNPDSIANGLIGYREAIREFNRTFKVSGRLEAPAIPSLTYPTFNI